MTNEHRRARPKAKLADRIALYFCKSRSVDGLWIGSLTGGEAEPNLRRVEEALGLIKRYDPIQYRRVIRNLDRVWVSLVPRARACFSPALQACVLDERYVLAAATTPDMVAKTIVHEATHARLDRLGIGYEEKERVRVEAVCMRRELAFAARLPQGKPLQEEVERKMEWCAANPEFFSNARMHQRSIEGHVEALRHVGMPEWLIQGVLRINIGISAMRRLVRRVAQPARRASG